MEEKKDYRISFFKPTTAFSRTNRNLVIVLIIIWALAIFGFQTLLRVIEKPVKEPALNTFNAVWAKVNNGTATTEEKAKFGGSLLSVLGKSSLLSSSAKKEALENAFSWVVYDLLPSEQKDSFQKQVATFEGMEKDLEDKNYKMAKGKIIKTVFPVLTFEANDPFVQLKRKLIPFQLKSKEMKTFNGESKKNVEGIMNLFLTHNRSVLTDTEFLGFPFHYFYTAVFLLILFVSLCWIYCYIIDKINIKNGNTEG